MKSSSPMWPSSCPLEATNRTLLAGLADCAARMISSQQARPPPRSLAQLHQPLRGVITTRGAALLSVPSTVATTLTACVCVRWTWAVSTVFAPCRAQSAKNGASSLETCSTGGPKGCRKLSALLGENPGSGPQVTTTMA